MPSRIPASSPALRRGIRVAGICSAATGSAAALILLAAWVAGGRLLDAGSRGAPPIPAPPEPGFEAARFTARDGVELRGWWAPGSRAGAVLLLHGWNADRRAMLPRARWLREAGFATLLLDLRGCGESAGRSTFGHDERLDVLSAVEFLRREQGIDRVVLLGVRSGGAAAILAAVEEPGVRGVVVESAFDRFESLLRARVRESAGDLSGFLLPLVRRQVRWRLGFDPAGFAPAESVARLGVPVLIAAGGEDRLVPPDSASSLFWRTRTSASLWILPKAADADLFEFDTKLYRERVGEFVTRCLGGTQPA